MWKIQLFLLGKMHQLGKKWNILSLSIELILIGTFHDKIGYYRLRVICDFFLICVITISVVKKNYHKISY